MQIQKYPDTCGRGLSQSLNRPQIFVGHKLSLSRIAARTADDVEFINSTQKNFGDN